MTEKPPGPKARAEHLRALLDPALDGPEPGQRELLRIHRRTVGAAPVLGVHNFLPIGPTLVRNGATATRASVSGRVVSLVVLPGGVVYAGSANGGVWRSDNDGESWIPLMDGITRKTVAGNADSLAVGAVAVPHQMPNRVYVGTGEGGAFSYSGVGPLRSDDGGVTWSPEIFDTPNPAAGSSFYALAVDPLDPEAVLAATDQGLYRREPRNQSIPHLPSPRPTAYQLVYTPGDGVWSVEYWGPDGRTLHEAHQGANPLPRNLLILPVELGRAPYLVMYKRNGVGGVGAAGNIWVTPVADDGVPTFPTVPTAWAADLEVFTFAHGGEIYLVRYDPAGAGINMHLARFDTPYNGQFTDTATTADWHNWVQVLPIVLEGVPMVIFYGDNTNAVTTRFTLKRWNPDLTLSQVWTGDATFAANQRLLVVHVNGATRVLQQNVATGALVAFRFRQDGTPRKVWTSKVMAHLALEPFLFPDRQGGQFSTSTNLLGSDPNTTTALYRMRPDRGPTPISGRLGTQTSLRTAYNIGHRWADITSALMPPPLTRDGTNTLTRTVTSVVSATDGKRTFVFCAAQVAWGASVVFHSADHGRTWIQLGSLDVVGRVTLACQPDNPFFVYAFCADSRVFRFDLGARPNRGWRPVQGVPPASVLAGNQGFYDLAIAVSPEDVNRIYLGGAGRMATSVQGRTWGAALYRCDVVEENGELRATPLYIGATVHADVHAFAFAPGRANELWVGCDGGVFMTRSANTAAVADLTHLFGSLNAGLNTMTANTVLNIGDEDALGYSSTQDNGLQFYRGGLVWDLASGGDSGFSARQAPTVFMSYEKFNQGLSASGEPDSFSYDETYQHVLNFFNEPARFYPPMAALGGSLLRGSIRPWLSTDLGVSWAVINTLGGPPVAPSPGPPYPGPPAYDQDDVIQAICWESANRFYTGTLNKLRRYDRALGVWTATEIVGIPAATAITSITQSSAGLGHVFVAVNGAGPRFYSVDTAIPVWVPAGVTLPLAPLTVVREFGANVYAGGNLGVWRSGDAGVTWEAFSQGLPEAAVLDIQHFPAVGGPRNRPELLRVVTHGRGQWDRQLAGPVLDTKLLLRANLLDRGLEPRRSVAYPIPNPAQVSIWDGLAVRVSRPDSNGRFPLPADISYGTFWTGTPDDWRDLRQNQPARLYIEVCNRGSQRARRAHIRIFLSARYHILPVPIPAHPSGIPVPGDLPDNYWTLTDPTRSVGYDLLALVGVPEITAEAPQIVSIDLPSSAFALPGCYAVVAIANSRSDPFASHERNVATLITAERRVVAKLLVVR